MASIRGLLLTLLFLRYLSLQWGVWDLSDHPQNKAQGSRYLAQSTLVKGRLKTTQAPANMVSIPLSSQHPLDFAPESHLLLHFYLQVFISCHPGRYNTSWSAPSLYVKQSRGQGSVVWDDVHGCWGWGSLNGAQLRQQSWAVQFCFHHCKSIGNVCKIRSTAGRE